MPRTSPAGAPTSPPSSSIARTTSGQGSVGLQQDGRERVDQRHRRADRQVDPAGRDDEGHRHRDDQQRRRLAQQIEEIDGGQERVGAVANSSTMSRKNAAIAEQLAPAP